MSWLKNRLADAERKKAERARLINEPQQKTISVVKEVTEVTDSNCKGCRSSWRDAYNFFETSIDLSVFVTQMALGTKVIDDTYYVRKSSCETCQICDSKGDRLYREYIPGRHSCGVPRFDWIFRDPSVEGCGCWLELKWYGINEKCPLKTPRW
jgi:hypothetical protein